MMPASNNGLGGDLCPFTDICPTLVGPALVPIPYPNLGMSAMSAPFSPNVFVGIMPALNMMSAITMTSCDEPGVPGGRIKMPGMVTMGNPVTFINGAPAKNLLCITNGNAMNAFFGMTTIPSITTTFYTDSACLNAVDATAADPKKWSLAAEAARDMTESIDIGAPGDPVTGKCLPGGVVILRIERFVRNLSSRVYSTIRHVAPDELHHLVIDLRGCPGGVLDAALQLAEDFLERDCVIAIRCDGEDDEMAMTVRQDDPYLWPTTLLVDNDTASAAELFVGALQTNGRATVVGETTAGKASAQAMLPKEDAQGVHYRTIANFLLPDRRSFQGCGLTPHHASSGTDALKLAIHHIRSHSRS